jgi:hypothetical protein
MRVPRGAWLAAAAAAACYLNALPAEFAFDDHFALTYNGDVTDARKPLSALWRNDFWGQDIRGEGSHKSYRYAPRRACQVRMRHSPGLSRACSSLRSASLPPVRASVVVAVCSTP